MGQVSKYIYESDGALSKSTDRNGVVTDYTYDGLGRLINQTNSENGNLKYTYNDFGQVTSITDGKVSVQSTYNNFGDLISIIRDRNSEKFEYDADGRLVNHVITDRDMGTMTTKYSYDALGRPTAIETDVGIELLTYDKAGRISEKSFPKTGTKKVYSYYKNGV